MQTRLIGGISYLSLAGDLCEYRHIRVFSDCTSGDLLIPAAHPVNLLGIRHRDGCRVALCFILDMKRMPFEGKFIQGLSNMMFVSTGETRNKMATCRRHPCHIARGSKGRHVRASHSTGEQCDRAMELKWGNYTFILLYPPAVLAQASYTYTHHRPCVPGTCTVADLKSISR
jgi:hypothetical protein